MFSVSNPDAKPLNRIGLIGTGNTSLLGSSAAMPLFGYPRQW
jgi:hypothetical protein